MEHLSFQQRKQLLHDLFSPVFGEDITYILLEFSLVVSACDVKDLTNRLVDVFFETPEHEVPKQIYSSCFCEGGEVAYYDSDEDDIIELKTKPSVSRGHGRDRIAFLGATPSLDPSYEC